jgi:hypothetical protein
MADNNMQAAAATDFIDVSQDAAPAINVAALLAAIKDDPAVTQGSLRESGRRA